MTITAKVIADSTSPQGIRLTTMQLRYPKMIHSEFMTHRVFSRNASSSRAIPVARLIQDVIDDPAMPVFWGSNKPGMQAGEELTGDWRQAAINEWLLARNRAAASAIDMGRYGVHKQIVNRIIEPWCHINVVVTATEWANFYALRQHKDAQPEMKALADAMWEAQQTSIPTPCVVGGWHLPYYDPETDGKALYFADLGGDPFQWMIRVSVARCARVSFLTHEGKPPNVEDDLKLYDRLVGSTPLHASPAEHQATPDKALLTFSEGANAYRVGINDSVGFQYPEQHGNLVGWRQYRKMLPNENRADR
jgi:thymidylate synthase ThyX